MWSYLQGWHWDLISRAPATLNISREMWHLCVSLPGWSLRALVTVKASLTLSPCSGNEPTTASCSGKQGWTQALTTLPGLPTFSPSPPSATIKYLLLLPGHWVHARLTLSALHKWAHLSCPTTRWGGPHLCPHHHWIHWGTERLRNLSQVSQLRGGGPEHSFLFRSSSSVGWWKSSLSAKHDELHLRQGSSAILKGWVYGLTTETVLWAQGGS